METQETCRSSLISGFCFKLYEKLWLYVAGKFPCFLEGQNYFPFIFFVPAIRDNPNGGLDLSFPV